MKLPQRILEWLRTCAMYVAARSPDFVIGNPDNPYLLRWYVIPRNRFFNIYLHRFLRSDDDRALHDHPWPNLSILLQGGYVEHTIAAGGINVRTPRASGEMKFRFPTAAHRVELSAGPCWTLFITGPRMRDWGFHCPTRWKPWQEFTDPKNSGAIGPGCDDRPALQKPPRNRIDEQSEAEIERERAAWLENKPPLAFNKKSNEHAGTSE